MHAGDHDTITASSDFGDAVMTGEEFRARVHAADASLDQQAFNDLWPRLSVLARCSPQDKFTIIQGCQAYRLPGDRRDIVAMTGALLCPAPAMDGLRSSDLNSKAFTCLRWVHTTTCLSVSLHSTALNTL